MLIELGNHAFDGSAAARKIEADFGIPAAVDDRPKVTTIHIPEFDDGSNHPDGTPTGGYTHVPGSLSVAQFQREIFEAEQFRNGIYRLKNHEAALAAHLAWREHAADRPAWLQVTPHADGLTHPDVVSDLEGFLHEHFGTDGAQKPLDVEEKYHTRHGEPGVFPAPPPLQALLTNDGRVIANVNDGGGQVGVTGVGTAATATTLTTNQTLVTNAWAGYRVYCWDATLTKMRWGFVVSNTNAAGASVLTIDRWYDAATPGGSAATTPASGFQFLLADGGAVSSWFVALATGVNAPAATDHTLATNGNVEYVTAGGGFVRKIAPYAQTSGVASRALTLVPVFTGNGSDTYPSTFTTIGVLVSMVVGITGTMKFETALNASATPNASGDQVTVTETVSGS